MTRFTSYAISGAAAALLALASIPGAAAGKASASMDGREEAADTVQGALMLLSDETVSGLFPSGFIPPPPQAAAITRYAEYPVSHTTGLPDISVPLYEIDLGGFRLPLSISYHAAGCRPDEIPGYVGSGWTLNAGGAVTRTILGKPDRPMTDSNIELPCYDDGFVRDMLEDVQKTGGGPGVGYIASIVGLNEDHDTESDRYSFSVAGHSGVFRYDHVNGEYVILNNSNWVVEAFHGGPRFRIVTNDQTEYEFDVEERSGLGPTATEPPYPTAWYVTRIRTPYGEIGFRYGSGHSLSVHRGDAVATAGPRLEMTARPTLSGDTVYEFNWLNSKQPEMSDCYLSYQQRPLESIEWSGGKVVFEYDEGHRYETLRRLTAMKVMDPSGDVRKKVEFDNTDNWPTGSSLTGRRLLRSVSDSELGTWTFGYDKSVALPGWSTDPGVLCPAQHTDYWGFLNTSRPSGQDSVFTARQLAWLQEAAEHTSWRIGTRDRGPSLTHTMSGVLNSVTFPTGGKVTYTYELNRFAGRDVSDLRVRSYTVHDGSGFIGRTTTYEYRVERRTAEDPEDLMSYLSHRQVKPNPDFAPPHIGVPYPVEIRTCVPFPVNPVSGASCPVVYSHITENRPDGTSVTYRYDVDELSQLYGVGSEYVHPSLYYQSVNDWGIREPLLLRKTVRDKDGNAVLEEEHTYLKAERRTFAAGVRTICPYYEHTVPMDRWQPVTVTPELVAKFGVPQHTVSTAHVRANLLASTTSTDVRTGFSTRTVYTYDDSLRTIRPRSVTTVGSCGDDIRTDYAYAFDLDDWVSKRMAGLFYMTDTPVEETAYAGAVPLSETRTEYGFLDGWCHPMAVRKWSAPTGHSGQGVPSVLPECGRVSGYNMAGRPLSVTVNGTDETAFTWNAGSNLLESVTAPGGWSRNIPTSPSSASPRSPLPTATGRHTPTTTPGCCHRSSTARDRSQGTATASSAIRRNRCPETETP